MLYTPILPEAASGTLEPRHVVVPLRAMCPHAELLLARATALDEAEQLVTAESDLGIHRIRYKQLVVALGAVSRTLPVPGLAEHGLGFKSLADAIYLRNHVLRQLEEAAAAREPEERSAHLTFVFVGAGYAGVEALAELSDLVGDALRYYPGLRKATQRWVLVDAAPKILPEIPPRLGEYAARDRGLSSIHLLLINNPTLTKFGAEGHVLLRSPVKLFCAPTLRIDDLSTVERFIDIIRCLQTASGLCRKLFDVHDNWSSRA